MTLLIAASLIGVGYGLVNPAAAAILAYHSPLNARGLFFSIKQTAVPVGFGLSGLLFPFLLLWLRPGRLATSKAVLTMVITAATPMMMPRAVRMDRMVFRRRARRAILIVMMKRIMAKRYGIVV